MGESPDLRGSFQVCRDELKHEYGVLASRLTAYITSQAFLVSAFAVAMNNSDPAWGSRYRLLFPLLLSIMGVVLSVRANPGIKGVCQIIERWHIRQSELLAVATDELDDWEVLRQPTVATVNERNLWFAQTSPWIFGASWTLMGLIVIWASTVMR
jgi:hypothetical protein